MRRIAIVGLMLGCWLGAQAQTSSGLSPLWNDPNAWIPAAVPTGASGSCASGSPATGTCNSPLSIGHTFTINVNVSITTGVYYFGWNGTGVSNTNVTDAAGGTAYSLTLNNAGGNTSTQCILDIRSGTTTFEGALSMDNSNIYVRTGATLVVGPATINNATNIVVEAGATMIINGNFNNNNNGSGTITIGGLIHVNGNYITNNGGVAIDGGGDLTTTGTIDQQGSSNIFGNTGDCTTGPCSGRNLCPFTNSVASSQLICSGSTPATLTATTDVNGTYTYKWQSSTTSISGTYSDISGATTTTYSPPALTQTTWYRFYIAKTGGGACTSTSVPKEVTVVSSTGGWLGTTNDWHLGSNWCGGSVPTSTSDVTIAPMPTALGKVMPIITTTANTRNLTILNHNFGSSYLNASVTLSGASTLNIYGNLDNDETLTDNASSNINFVGSSNQTIGGAAINSLTKVTINNTSPTQPSITLIDNNLVISGTLTMTQGNINLGGIGMQIGTSATTLGSISRTAGWMYNGNLTRYVGTAGSTQLFPLGLSTVYRPLNATHTGLTAGGYLSVSHNGILGTSITNFDDTGDDVGAINVVRRSDAYWTINTNGITGAGTPYSITAGGTAFGTVTNLNHLRLTQSGSTVGTWVTGDNTGSFTDFLVKRSGLSTGNLANNFYVGSIDVLSPLPITLSDFNARLINKGVELNWVTSSEINFNYFEVEKSTNGENFSAIGKVQGHGTSYETHYYSLVDQNPSIGRNYYRLKSIDFDGYTETFKVLGIDYSAEKSFSIAPNPSTGTSVNFKLNYAPKGEFIITIYDHLGNVVNRHRFSGNEQTLSINNHLSSGVYFAKLITEDFIRIERFIVE